LVSRWRSDAIIPPEKSFRQNNRAGADPVRAAPLFIIMMTWQSAVLRALAKAGGDNKGNINRYYLSLRIINDVL
jgi:hypothetical protein